MAPLIIIGAAAAIAGAGLSAFGSIQSGISQSEAYKTNAEIARQRGFAGEKVARREMAGVLSEQQARFAALGINPFAGSPLMLAGETVLEGELKAKRARWEGEAEAEIAKNAARQARIGGYFKAGSTFLATLGMAAMTLGAGGAAGAGASSSKMTITNYPTLS